MTSLRTQGIYSFPSVVKHQPKAHTTYVVIESNRSLSLSRRTLIILLLDIGILFSRRRKSRSLYLASLYRNANSEPLYSRKLILIHLLTLCVSYLHSLYDHYHNFNRERINV